MPRNNWTNIALKTILYSDYTTAIWGDNQETFSSLNVTQHVRTGLSSMQTLAWADFSKTTKAMEEEKLLDDVWRPKAGKLVCILLLFSGLQTAFQDFSSKLQHQQWIQPEEWRGFHDLLSTGPLLGMFLFVHQLASVFVKTSGNANTGYSWRATMRNPASIWYKVNTWQVWQLKILMPIL